MFGLQHKFKFCVNKSVCHPEDYTGGKFVIWFYFHRYDGMSTVSITAILSYFNFFHIDM